MITKKREVTLALLAGICVAVMALDRFVIGPLTRGWDARNRSIDELQLTIQRGNSLLDREESWAAARSRMEERGLPAVPSEAENRVLRSIDRWAGEANLAIGSLRPSWKQNGHESQMLELRASAAGTMDAITRFLYLMDTSDLAIAAEDLMLSSRKSDTDVLTLNLRITGVCRSAGAAGAASGGQAK